MPSIRRKTCAKHMVADYGQSRVSIPLPIAMCRLDYIFFSWLATAVATFSKQDQNTTDDGRHVPSSERLISPFDDRAKDVHGCRL